MPKINLKQEIYITITKIWRIKVGYIVILCTYHSKTIAASFYQYEIQYVNYYLNKSTMSRNSALSLKTYY